MSTTAASLLKIMEVRLSLQEAGISKPHASVQSATKRLVGSLRFLPPHEIIQIECTLDPLHAQYIRQSTGEVLAEICQNHEA